MNPDDNNDFNDNDPEEQRKRKRQVQNDPNNNSVQKKVKSAQEKDEEMVDAALGRGKEEEEDDEEDVERDPENYRMNGQEAAQFQQMTDRGDLQQLQAMKQFFENKIATIQPRVTKAYQIKDDSVNLWNNRRDQERMYATNREASNEAISGSLDEANYWSNKERYFTLLLSEVDNAIYRLGRPARDNERQKRGK